MGHKNSSTVAELVLVEFSSHPRSKTPLFFLFSPAYLANCFGNTAVITLVVLHSPLQTPMYFFLCHLAFLNIFFSAIVVPKMLYNFLATRKVISYHFCLAQTYITLFLEVTECFLLAVMALDRCVAICFPLRYIPAGGHDVAGGAGTVLLPFLLIILSYLRILVAVMRIDSVEGRKKAFSTCTSHLTVVTIYYGTGLIRYMRPKSLYSAEGDKLITLFYAVINPTLNPFIYSLNGSEAGYGKSYRKIQK
ncbi:hypothetical protein H8959_017117 [Pygathrix nigripes]